MRYNHYMTTNASNPIPIGTQFRSTYADSNPLFEVTDHFGPGAVEAVIVNDIGHHRGAHGVDYAGTLKAFSVEDVKANVQFASSIQSIFAASDDFWAGVEVGTQLHYHNGFGQFVRGVVVLDDDTFEKSFSPIALVNGARKDGRDVHGWGRHELPSWSADGKAHYPYHAQSIVDGDTWIPGASNLWEASARLQNEYERPDNSPALDLSIPDRTDEQLLDHAKRSLANEAIALLQQADPDLKGAADLIERWAVHGVS